MKKPKTSPSEQIHKVIEGEIRGEYQGIWRLDKFGAKDPPEQRFKVGDNQAVLWEIYACAGTETVIPRWAATAYRSLLMQVVTGQKTWSEAFGKIPEGRGQRRRVQTDAWLADVCALYNEKVRAGEKIDNALLKQIGKDLGVGSSTVVKDLLKKGEKAGLIQRRIRG